MPESPPAPDTSVPPPMEDAFMTGISTTRGAPSSSQAKLHPNVRNPELSTSKFEHDKLQAIVTAFGEKIDVMKQNQENEYVEAYDVHMRDVQRQLHELKELLAEVTSESKKAEKLQELQDDQALYKQEAVRLDQSTISGRKKIRDMTAKLHSVERERDWLLKRLRKEKKRLKYLNKKLDERMELSHGDGSGSVFTDASSVSFEVISPLGSPMSPLRSPHSSSTPLQSIANSDQKRGNIEESVYTNTSNRGNHLSNGDNDDDDDMNDSGMKASRSNRENRYDDEDDDISEVTERVLEGRNDIHQGRGNNESNMSNLEDEMSYNSSSMSAITVDTNVTTKKFKSVGKLVKQRMVIDELQRMLSEAVNQTVTGFWTKFASSNRPLGEIVDDCVTMTKIGEEPSEKLLNELMAQPEVYQVISSLVNAGIQRDSYRVASGDDSETVNTGVQSVLSCYF